MESDYLKNGNKMHMTNKIPQGGESQYRLEWAHCNLALILAVLNVNLNRVAVCIYLFSCDGVYVQYITLCVGAVYYVKIPCWRPSRWQSVEFSVCLVVPDTSPAHLESLWPAAGEAPLYQINTARHYGMDSTPREHSHTVQTSKRLLKWNLKWAVWEQLVPNVEFISGGM